MAGDRDISFAVITLVIVCFVGIIYSFTAPWFVATKVTSINTCCQFELNITGYLFKDYKFSSTIKTSCYKTSCANYTIDDFFNLMEFDIKQDTSSAESTLAFVRASPLLLLGHMVASIPLCVASHYESAWAKILIELLMTAMTISAIAGVAVYCTVYINQIGFNFGDLVHGLEWTVAVCSLNLIFDMILVCCIVVTCKEIRDEERIRQEYAKGNKIKKKRRKEIRDEGQNKERRKTCIRKWIQDRKEGRKANSRKDCIANISQPYNIQTNRSPIHKSQTNTSLTCQPQNKITADDFIFVKLNDRDTIVDIHESVRYKHAWTCTDDIDNAVTDLPKTIKLKIDTFEISKDDIVIYFKKLLDNIWDQDLVGKGADAKNLSHKTLNVISVDPGYKDFNINVRKYMGYRSILLKRTKRFGKLPCLNAAHCSPIQTTEFIENVPKEYLRLMGLENLNTRLNEYFLFHGTNECNVENILEHGFDISKVKRPFLGKGIYFTENPVKADQYTGYGSSSTGCILLCRVMLGNFIIRKTNPKSNMTSWTHLPCSRCLDEDCSQHSPNERFDSLIYDQPHGLFREFVMFNTDQILVESVIKYTRVTDSDNLD